MTDQDRRQEILKAEEAVRLLAKELWQVNQSQAAVEKVTRSLSVAQTALEQSTAANQNAVQMAAQDVSRRLAAAQSALEQSDRANQRAVQSLESCAREARASLQEARNQLEAVETDLGAGIRELRAAAGRLDELPAALEKCLAQGLGGVLNGIDALRREHERLAEKPRQQLLSIRRLAVTLVLLTVFSVGNTVACLILLLMR